MNWPALGHDPAPGDEGQILALADRFRSVSQHAEDLVTGLRAVDGGTGDAVWTGPGSEAFRGLLQDVWPVVYRLNTAYMQADQALRRYARDLGDAQQAARLAETAGEQAQADQARARADQDRADADARSCAVQAAAAQARYVQGQAQRLLAPTDPVYQAQMQSYLAYVSAQRDRAQAQGADARRRSAGAATAMADADRRLAQARARGADAGRDRDDAARRLVDELRSAEPPRRNWGLLGEVTHLLAEGADKVDGIVGLLKNWGVQELKDGGARWKQGLSWLREDVGLTAKQLEGLYGKLEQLSTRLEKLNKEIETFARETGAALGKDVAKIGKGLGKELGKIGETVGKDFGEIGDTIAKDSAKIGKNLGKIAPSIKVLGLVAVATDVMNAAHEQREEDAEKLPAIGDTERLFREIGAAVAVGALSASELVGGNILVEIGAAIGAGIGNAPGAVLGGLLGMALSTAINAGMDLSGGKAAIRDWGASLGSTLYHKLADVAGGSGDASTLAGAADTSGSVWTAMAA